MQVLSTTVMSLANIYFVDGAGDRIEAGSINETLDNDAGLIEWHVPPDERYKPKTAA